MPGSPVTIGAQVMVTPGASGPPDLGTIVAVFPPLITAGGMPLATSGSLCLMINSVWGFPYPVVIGAPASSGSRWPGEGSCVSAIGFPLPRACCWCSGRRPPPTSSTSLRPDEVVMALAKVAQFGSDLRLLDSLERQSSRKRGSDLSVRTRTRSGRLDLETVSAVDNIRQALLLRLLTPVASSSRSGTRTTAAGSASSSAS